MARRKRQVLEPQPADAASIAKALTKAVCDGDIVNFRQIFSPLSPLRPDTIESVHEDKYTHLLPTPAEEEEPEFREVRKVVEELETWAHIERELEAKRPPQMPSNLILRLADNAIKQGKYTAAAQAYELLRIRPRMRDEFYRLADEALEAGDVAKAVEGYVIATGLFYDYAAFPEPLPDVPDFQKRALIIHAEYPQKPEDALPLKAPEAFLDEALIYLLDNPGAAERLGSQPMDRRIAFFKELVFRRDPAWQEFAERFIEACDVITRYNQQIAEVKQAGNGWGEYAKQFDEGGHADPRRIPGILLGRTIEEGAWWQYLKELAYEHPPSILFIARQYVGRDEILIPQVRKDSPVLEAVGLNPDRLLSAP